MIYSLVLVLIFALAWEFVRGSESFGYADQPHVHTEIASRPPAVDVALLAGGLVGGLRKSVTDRFDQWDDAGRGDGFCWWI